MNCKPNDLAVISYPGNSYDGYIVRCVQFVGGEHNYWRIDRLLPEQAQPWIADCILRPIRDQDGEDQTLTWAGKPADIKTPEAA